MSCSSLLGQSGRQKKADKLFNSFSFQKAIENYEKLIKKDYNTSYAQQQIGDAYMMQRKPEKAVQYYRNIVHDKNTPSEYYYNYAQALRGIEDYSSSILWMNKFKETHQNDTRVTRFFEKKDISSAIFNIQEKYTIKPLTFNTKYSDYGATRLDSSIVFVSTRDPGVSIIRTYAWNNQPFLDMYIADKNGHISKIKGDVNSIYHEGTATFNHAKTRMYFTRNNYLKSKKRRDKEGTVNLKIFMAELINNEWKNIQETSLNSDDFSTGHPSLNKEGTQLYFTSNRPGSIGGSDIYVADVSSNGTISNPTNLGSIVNTEGNEMFPFIHEEGTLFFSSDGHLGLGMLDVFATVKDDKNNIINTINLGKPLNSNRDDFAYYLAPEGYSGYISSNRKGGMGDDDIYSFERTPPPPSPSPFKIIGTVIDQINKLPITGATVVIFDKSGTEIVTLTTDSNGKFEYPLDRDAHFSVTGSKVKYTSATVKFDTYNQDKTGEVTLKLTINIPLKPIENVVLLADLNIIYFDLNQSYIRSDAAYELNKVVNLMNKYPGMVIRLESHTDSRGNDAYNLSLSNRRAKSTYDYIIQNGIAQDRISDYQGFGESQLVNECFNGIRCIEAAHQRNRRTEFVIIKMK
ncbi:MAG: flagellar motor protein MotB [Flavobacteriaceae bacterium]|nr:MAG: flagellar motor protein MotB [Flavobacteriaceae bacterium]